MEGTGRISMYVLLVCVWCSLGAGGFLMVVNAQTAVTAVILTPEADHKEGGQVEMRCTATNLDSDHIVEWRTEDPGNTLRWGGTTVSTNERLIFDTSVDMITQTVVQDFTITNVQRADTDEYVCNVIEPIPTGGNDILATSSVTLSVLYFPSASFPMCSPAGPITVDAGTELHMTCSSESSHGTVSMTINPTMLTSRYATWTSVINNDIDTVVRTLDLTVDDGHDGVAFACVITSMYFKDMQRTCLIGPIVRNTKPTKPTLAIGSPSPSATLWILASMVITVFAFVFIVIIIFIFLVKDLTSKKESQDIESDPYTELQPIEDNNQVYTEPSTAGETTTIQGSYQSVEVDNESPEHDYSQPDQAENESPELDYVIPNDHNEQQRIDPQVGVPLESRPESMTTDIQHTYSQPDEGQTESPEPDYIRPE